MQQYVERKAFYNNIWSFVWGFSAFILTIILIAGFAFGCYMITSEDGFSSLTFEGISKAIGILLLFTITLIVGFISDTKYKKEIEKNEKNKNF